VTRDWAPNSADRFWSALECGHYTPDEFIWVVQNKYVEWGFSGNTTDDSLWNVTFPSDVRTQPNAYGYVSFYENGVDTGTVLLIINLANNTDFDSEGLAPFGLINSAGMMTVEKFYSGYGLAPDQSQILSVGQSYLKQNFPNLDYNIALYPTVHCPPLEKTCVFDPTDPFSIECCTNGESCIAGVGCRCLDNALC